MKTALCISGHLREYKKCFPTIKKFIIDKYNPDIFISSWSVKGYWTKNDDKGINEGEKIDIYDLVSLYNPKIIDIEIFNENIQDIFMKNANSILENNPRLRWGRKQNIIGMYYKIARCNNLRIKYEIETNIKYDLIIRIRPDIFIKDISNILISDNTFYISSQDNGLLRDSLFMGSPIVMDKICSLITYLKEIYNKTNCLFDPHDLLYNFIKYFNIQYKTFNCDVGLINTTGGYC